jgi:hypothetical protein
MAVEQILGGIDVEGGMGLLVKGTQPDPLLAEAGTIRLPVVALQILQQRYALFEPLQILGHDAVFASRVELTAESSALARQGWWAARFS